SPPRPVTSAQNASPPGSGTDRPTPSLRALRTYIASRASPGCDAARRPGRWKCRRAISSSTQDPGAVVTTPSASRISDASSGRRIDVSWPGWAAAGSVDNATAITATAATNGFIVEEWDCRRPAPRPGIREGKPASAPAVITRLLRQIRVVPFDADGLPAAGLLAEVYPHRWAPRLACCMQDGHDERLPRKSVRQRYALAGSA